MTGKLVAEEGLLKDLVLSLEDAEEYRRIHGLVFNRTDIDVPPAVIVGRNDDGDIVAFISGFRLADDHFYIQFSGVLPAYQKAGYLRYLECVLDNNVWYELAIENTNIVALKIALGVQFIPMGFIKQGEKYFVQLKRDKHG